jgi:hypothetical protein
MTNLLPRVPLAWSPTDHQTPASAAGPAEGASGLPGGPPQTPGTLLGARLAALAVGTEQGPLVAAVINAGFRVLAPSALPLHTILSASELGVPRWWERLGGFRGAQHPGGMHLMLSMAAWFCTPQMPAPQRPAALSPAGVTPAALMSPMDTADVRPGTGRAERR